LGKIECLPSVREASCVSDRVKYPEFIPIHFKNFLLFSVLSVQE